MAGDSEQAGDREVRSAMILKVIEPGDSTATSTSVPSGRMMIPFVPSILRGKHAVIRVEEGEVLDIFRLYHVPYYIVHHLGVEGRVGERHPVTSVEV